MKFLNVLVPILLALSLANCSIDVSVDQVTANDFMGSTILATSRGVGDGQVSASITVLLKNADGSIITGHKPDFVFIDNNGSAYTGNGITYSECSLSNSQGISTCTIRAITVGARKLMFSNIIIELFGQVYFDPPNRSGNFFQVLNSAQLDMTAGGYSVTSQVGAPFPGMVHEANGYTVYTNTTAGITPTE